VSLVVKCESLLLVTIIVHNYHCAIAPWWRS